MTAQELKNSILQLAIQGKLVKQDPNDEPASVLLEKIKEEREKLIKEKKIKREKYSEIYRDPSDNHYYEKFDDGTIKDITDEIPFEIPESWCWTRIKNLSSIVSKGTTPKGGKNAYLSKGINFLRAENVKASGKVSLENVMYIDEDTHQNFLKRSILEDKDILICIAGTLGRCAVITNEELPANTNQAVCFVRLINKNDLFINFILNALSSFEMQKSLLKKTKVTAIPNLTLEIISNSLIPIPPINEQKEINNKIKELLPYIEKYNEKQDLLEKLNNSYKEDLKKSILQYAIQGKLVPQNPEDESTTILIDNILNEKRQMMKNKEIKKEILSVIYKDSTDNQFYEKFDDGTINNITDEIPFEIPENWCWTRLNNIVKSINAGGDKPKTFSKNITDKNTIPVISNGEKNEGIFGFTDKAVIFEESLTISGRGTIGYSKIRTIPYVPIVRLLVLIPLANTNLEYLQLSIQALIERGVGTAVKQLTIPMIKPKLIPIPPLSEQTKILNIFNKYIQIIEK